jgi:hypothetical protein
MTDDVNDGDYKVERRTPAVGTPAYQTFEESFTDEGLSAREEYEDVEENFRSFYDWRQSNSVVGRIQSALSDLPGREVVDVNGTLDQREFDDVFTPVYFEDVDPENVDEYRGLQQHLEDRDAEAFVSNRDGLAFVSDAGAMLEVQRRGGEHWFNWHDSVMEDGEEFAHQVFADYMENLINEDYV